MTNKKSSWYGSAVFTHPRKNTRSNGARSRGDFTKNNMKKCMIFSRVPLFIRDHLNAIHSLLPRRNQRVVKRIIGEKSGAHTCAGSPKRVTFTGSQFTCQKMLFLYVEMSPEMLHFRFVASWLNCRATWASNSFMTTSLKSEGRPAVAKMLSN